MLTAFDLARARKLNDRPVNPAGRYVLYWMVASRRTSYNHGLERAVDYAKDLKRPLLVFEPLRAGHRWANARSHQFVIDGMADNRKRFERASIGYLGYVEPEHGDAQGLLERLAADACCVVTDDWPSYFVPRMLAAAGKRLTVRLEAVDSCGLLPLRAATRGFPSARGFRRFAHDYISGHLLNLPEADPLARARLPACPPLDPEILQRWNPDTPLAEVRVDKSVGPVPTRGGERAAREALHRFLEHGVDRYHEERNNLDDDPSSGLSPYLHFGHISAYEIARALADRSRWSPAKLTPAAAGAREGFWGMPRGPEAFLDQLLTWRELGFNMAALEPELHDKYESLPGWARKSLELHAGDPRPALYTEEQLEAAETHDPLWNAAQTQLVREGKIHNYLRMVWGKKVLEWSPSPRQALETLIELNNRWALDGRDPNSYSGIFWTFGRYDRPWFPEREVFGCIRYMSTASTARKLKVKGYLATYGSASESLEASDKPRRSKPAAARI